MKKTVDQKSEPATKPAPQLRRPFETEFDEAMAEQKNLQKAVDEAELLNRMSLPQILTGALKSVKQLLARAAGTGENPKSAITQR